MVKAKSDRLVCSAGVLLGRVLSMPIATAELDEKGAYVIPYILQPKVLDGGVAFRLKKLAHSRNDQSDYHRSNGFCHLLIAVIQG